MYFVHVSCMFRVCFVCEVFMLQSEDSTLV